MASMLMMFGGLSSAYMIRQSAGNFLEFSIPLPFFYSTAVLIASSIVLHLSYWSFTKEQAGLYRWGLFLTLILAFVFIVLQYQGWQAMASDGITLVGNPAGSFMYVIPGIHVAHVLGGVGALLMALIHAWALPVKATERRRVRFQLTLQYWHFVDFLWLYLMAFFALQRM
jgi:cytochrome c oxidase subunit III